MFGSGIIEEEFGTYHATATNPHQGYHAGDFSTRPSELDGFARAVAFASSSAR